MKLNQELKKLGLGLYLSMNVCFSFAQEGVPLPISRYIAGRNGLDNTYRAITSKKSVTVAFLGGSITFNTGWRNLLCSYLQERYPNTKFHFIAAGIPSLGSLPHAFRLQEDVLDSGKVDLLFVEAAVNDQVNHTDSITQIKSLEGIVRHARASNHGMDIVMMSFADPQKTELYARGIVPLSVANHELIASYYHLPSVNLARAVSEKLANHEFNWDKDFRDLHPSPFGQQLYFSAIKELLELCLKAHPQYNHKKATSLKLPVQLNKDSFVEGRYLSIRHAAPDSGWRFIQSWNPENGQETRPGFVNVPMLTSIKPGSSFSLEFNGRAIGIAAVSGADAGILNYQIDNGPEKHVDLFTEWSRSLHLPWYILFGSGLSKGKHTLRVTLSGEKNEGSNGTACRIVHFLVNN